MNTSKKCLGMPPMRLLMRLLVRAMAARRHEERVSARARALELKRAASVAGGDVRVVCAVKMKVSAGRGTTRGRRGDEHAHALGSVAVGAPADGMNIVPADGMNIECRCGEPTAPVPRA